MIRAGAAIALLALAAPGIAAPQRPALKPAEAKRLVPSEGTFLHLDPAPKRFELIGSIHGAKNRYDLYFYNWTNPESHHGHQAVVVIRDARIYVGAYYVTVSDCSVRERVLTCWEDWGDGKRSSQSLTFAGGEPPKRGVLGGERVTLRP